MEYFCKKCDKVVTPLPCGCCFDCPHGVDFSSDKYIEVRMSLHDLYNLVKISQEKVDLSRFSYGDIYFKINEMKSDGDK